MEENPDSSLVWKLTCLGYLEKTKVKSTRHMRPAAEMSCWGWSLVRKNKATAMASTRKMYRGLKRKYQNGVKFPLIHRTSDDDQFVSGTPWDIQGAWKFGLDEVGLFRCGWANLYFSLVRWVNVFFFFIKLPCPTLWISNDAPLISIHLQYKKPQWSVFTKELDLVTTVIHVVLGGLTQIRSFRKYLY